jgi:hypothetical protein
MQSQIHNYELSHLAGLDFCQALSRTCPQILNHLRHENDLMPFKGIKIVCLVNAIKLQRLSDAVIALGSFGTEQMLLARTSTEIIANLFYLLYSRPPKKWGKGSIGDWRETLLAKYHSWHDFFQADIETEFPELYRDYYINQNGSTAGYESKVAELRSRRKEILTSIYGLREESKLRHWANTTTRQVFEEVQELCVSSNHGPSFVSDKEGRFFDYVSFRFMSQAAHGTSFFDKRIQKQSGNVIDVVDERKLDGAAAGICALATTWGWSALCDQMGGASPSIFEALLKQEVSETVERIQSSSANSLL